MIRRWSLSTKILLLALLNVSLLVAVCFAFASVQFRFQLASFLFAPARERIVGVSRLLALQLPDTPHANWSKLLDTYSSRYPARFYLFSDDGTQLAGQSVTLPAAFGRMMRRDPFAHHGGPPPPPPPPGEMHGPPPPPMRPEHGPFMEGFRHGGMPDAPLQMLRTSNPAQYWIGVRIPIHVPDRDDPIHGTLVWRVPSLWTETFFFDYRPWLVMAFVIALISAACWIPLIRGLTSTISGISGATRSISDGHFDVKLGVDRGDELGDLSHSINAMAERLAGYVYGQKRFLGDIAHELSSPIARMQTALAILERRVVGDDAAYINDLREELDHVATLVNELLSFSKARLLQQPSDIQPVCVVDVVRRAVEREASSSDIAVDIAPDLLAQTDPDCFFRAVSNVVRNAVRYASDGGRIEIAAGPENGRVRLTISDHGPGIPEHELQNVFRPFYRPEFARTRETGGTGLGLAIVRSCIESCGGHVECRNRLPHGLVVVIELPAYSRS